jgi:hypothetical protein
MARRMAVSRPGSDRTRGVGKSVDAMGVFTVSPCTRVYRFIVGMRRATFLGRPSEAPEQHEDYSVAHGETIPLIERDALCPEWGAQVDLQERRGSAPEGAKKATPE